MSDSCTKIKTGQLLKSVLTGVVLAAGLLVLNFFGASLAADELQPLTMLGLRDGKITGIYETTFQIDHKTYSFAPEVVILDRHGDPLSASDLRVDIEVKYHLLKGTTDKIDQIILFLPL
jgi:hypothetical protein